MWTRIQRRFYHGDDPFLTPERKERLNGIGFWWGSPGLGHDFEPLLEKQWDENYEALVSYQKRKGRIMPLKRDRKVYVWLDSQRKLLRRGELRTDRKERLNSLGISWERMDSLARVSRKRKRIHESYDERSRDRDESGKALKECIEDSSDEAEINGEGVEDDYSLDEDPKPEPQASLVGKHAVVYWPDDDQYYRGKIIHQEIDGSVLIEYDDGDEERVASNEILDRCRFDVTPSDPLPARRVSPPLDSVKVGCRISVWWPEEEESNVATVKAIGTGKNSDLSFKLHYDDGDKRETDLSNCKFRLVKV